MFSPKSKRVRHEVGTKGGDYTQLSGPRQIRYRIVSNRSDIDKSQMFAYAHDNHYADYMEYSSQDSTSSALDEAIAMIRQLEQEHENLCSKLAEWCKSVHWLKHKQKKMCNEYGSL
ncbi:hypothetical protein K3495_g4501 [Podosphaera aphanis]|nr:hypothetical protein K3495_g4501 [Podosphaera aphanis]